MRIALIAIGAAVAEADFYAAIIAVAAGKMPGHAVKAHRAAV